MTLLGNATFGGMFSLFLARKVVDIPQREGKIPPFLHFPTESFIAGADLSRTPPIYRPEYTEQ